MSANNQLPSIERFEQAVTNKEYEIASNELLAILAKLDNNFGTTQNIECNQPLQLENTTLAKEEVTLFCTRIAVATAALFKDPNFHLTRSGAQRFFILHRWLGLIFAASPYLNADHILQTFNCNPNPESPNDFHLDSSESSLIKFCLLYFPESNINVNLDSLWERDPELCASLCIALQSPRFIATPAAFSKRSAILQWFPEKLATFPNMHNLPGNIFHDVYMHCSYDIAPNKHNVKRAVNQVIRNHILALGWQDRDVSQIGYHNGKPVMMVLLEHFNSSHSIYRTHSTSMVAARQHFHLVGLGHDAVDEMGQAVFDEFYCLSNNSIMDKLLEINKICDQYRPAVFYMPSIGMDLTTIFASNTRFAPIQAIALGHPATTHSDFIDYVIVEDDYVGSEDCFSETLLRLPKDALPYVPSAAAPNSVEYFFRENPEIVHIGVASTTMKLNPYFLEACKAILDRANVKVHFHFALGQSTGVTHPYVERFIKSYLGGNATAYAHHPYEHYLRILYNCDMMINPFPFGNTNGIIDMVTLGLVGVCKTGPEVHEHIDEGLFKRLGLPEWLIANTVDEYVERAIRLAENHQERLALRRHIIENNGLQTLFTGDPSPMGNIFLEKVTEWTKRNNPKAETKATQEKPKAEKKAGEKKTSKKAAPKSDEKAVKKPAAKTAKAKEASKKTATKAEKKASPLKEAAKALKKTK